MVKVTLDLSKSIEENASDYFEKAKKIKRKIEGAKQALNENIKKLADLESKKEKLELKKEKEQVYKKRKKEWYEKFRWFISSEGFLVIGGRDSTSNEVVIKKHTDTNDLVFHTDLAGSPFFVVKSETKKIGQKTIEEVADATCTFSRVWKLGLQTSPVFYVNPQQVSKKAKSGEYMGKGAFMIYGKTNYANNKVNLAIGMTESNQIMSGPLESVRTHCKKYLVLIQGDEKASAIAKKIQHCIAGAVDDIIRALPGGEFKIKK
jgi:predicted ribosome quality control (RQC) complex YloA/Tae2 family protein